MNNRSNNNEEISAHNNHDSYQESYVSGNSEYTSTDMRDNNNPHSKTVLSNLSNFTNNTANNNDALSENNPSN